VGVMDPAEVISMLPALDVTNGVVVAELTVVSAIAWVARRVARVVMQVALSARRMNDSRCCCRVEIWWATSID
jgi:hypothetical protein